MGDPRCGLLYPLIHIAGVICKKTENDQRVRKLYETLQVTGYELMILWLCLFTIFEGHNVHVPDTPIISIKSINISFIKIFLMMKMVESYMSCTGNKKADSANTRKTTPPINVTERQKKTMNRQGWKKIHILQLVLIFIDCEKVNKKNSLHVS